jgi:hypothetical protein
MSGAPPNCDFSLPCSQSSTSDIVTHRYVLEINCTDNGGAIVGQSSVGAAISGSCTNDTNTASGIAVLGTAQLGPGGQFNSENIGVEASGGNIAVTATGGSVGVQASGSVGVHSLGAGFSGVSPPPISQAAVFAEGGPAPGVYATSTTTNAVLGTLTDPNGSDEAAGVYGVSLAAGGNGVIGEANNGSDAYGVWGKSTSGLAGFFEGNVQVNGNLAATGTKPFIQAHPTDPSKEIVYISLEGGEAGTYVRGTGRLVDGKAVVALPEHFALVTEHQGLTIQLTPRGTWLQLYMVELDTTQLLVREAQGQSGAFDYIVHGIRRGYAQHEVIRTKR